MSGPGAAAEWGRVRAALEQHVADADAAAREMAAAMQRDVPGYADVAIDEIVPGVRADLERALRAVIEDRGPTADELDASEAVGAQRADQGVSVEAMLQAFRVALRIGLQRGRRALAQADAGEALALEFSDRLWDWSDLVMQRAATGHRRAELAAARRELRRRDDVLHGLVTGALAPARLRAEAPVVGLEPDGRYVALRGRPADHDLRHRLEATLAAHVADVGGLAGVVGGDVIAVARTPPRRVADAVVAMAGPQPLAELSAAFGEAAVVLTCADMAGRRGVVSLADVTLHAAVVADERTSTLLEQRCLVPLDAAGDFGAELERTLSTLLERGLRQDETARHLDIHVNTLRHRLARYREITGVDPREVDDLVAVWWALLARRIRRRH